jgi:hypothetical protein
MNNFNFDRNQMDNLEKYNKIMTSLMFKMIDVISYVVNFCTKNTKLIFGIILLTIIFKVGTYVVAIEPKGVYEITTSLGVVYNTNEIQVKDGCVHFKKMNTQEETIICGGATIVKSK